MTLKAKLISSIVAFILVASLMVVSIFASPTITMQIGGNVSFTATSVHATITGSIAGSTQYPTETSLTQIDIDYTDTTENITMPDDWSNMGLTFDENGTDIVVEITITNLASDRGIEIELTDSSSTSNYTIAKSASVGSSITGTTDTRSIGGKGVITYTFTLHVESRNNPASGQFTIGMKLNNTTLPTT